MSDATSAAHAAARAATSTRQPAALLPGHVFRAAATHAFCTAFAPPPIGFCVPSRIAAGGGADASAPPSVPLPLPPLAGLRGARLHRAHSAAAAAAVGGQLAPRGCAGALQVMVTAFHRLVPSWAWVGSALGCARCGGARRAGCVWGAGPQALMMRRGRQGSVGRGCQAAGDQVHAREVASGAIPAWWFCPLPCPALPPPKWPNFPRHSAGIGRTGTLMAIDIVLRRLWAMAEDGGGPPSSAAVNLAIDLPSGEPSQRPPHRHSNASMHWHSQPPTPPHTGSATPARRRMYPIAFPHSLLSAAATALTLHEQPSGGPPSPAGTYLYR